MDRNDNSAKVYHFLHWCSVYLETSSRLKTMKMKTLKWKNSCCIEKIIQTLIDVYKTSLLTEFDSLQSLFP